MMIMHYNLANLAPIHAAAKKDKARPILEHVIFDSQKSEATDGYMLVRVGAPKQEAADKIEPAAYHAKNLTNRIISDSDGAFSLDAIANPTDRTYVYKFPNTDQIMPADWKPDVIVNVEFLERMCKAVKQFYKQNKHAPPYVGIRFSTFTNREPLQFMTETNPQGQTFKGLIMPIKK